MLLSTCRYTAAGGWDKQLNFALDSESTLLIVFGASGVGDLASGIAELRWIFPLNLDWLLKRRRDIWPFAGG